MISLVVLDIDGCLSDGKIIYDANGLELKNFHVKDGFAIVHSYELGLEFAIITGRNTPIVTNRAKELRIKHIFQGVKDKLAVLEELCVDLGVDLSEVAAIGDDLNDLKLLRSVGMSFAPLDAVKEVRSSVDVVLERNGGDAVVRDMIEMILQKNGKYDEFVAKWL
ncbi:MAG: HAD-IIIA family hydrolase [Sulfuricurvum sp.]